VRTLPRAIAIALGVVLVVYVAVGITVLHVEGPVPAAERSSAPLVQLVHLVATPSFDAGTGVFSPAPMASAAVLIPWVRIAAAVAAGGALLSLLSGVGRTLFAMGRGGDAPIWLTPVSRHGVPHRAQLVAAAGAAAVALLGGIAGALAVSGASILLYYGVAHVAALRMGDGRPPRAVPWLGLAGCVLVASSLVVVGLGVVHPSG
jgi:APA family basic amino acid/polyamine antiporter